MKNVFCYKVELAEATFGRLLPGRYMQGPDRISWTFWVCPVAHVSLMEDLNALQKEMAEYDAAAREAIAEKRTPDGPSRKNLARLYERMGAHVTGLKCELENLREAEETNASIYNRARRQLTARLRQIAGRRRRRPKVEPFSIPVLQQQIALLDEAICTLYQDHEKGDKRGAKKDIGDEYLVRLEDIYIRYTVEIEKYVKIGPESSTFIHFAYLAWIHMWPEKALQDPVEVKEAIDSRIQRLRREGRIAKYDPSD